MGLMSRRRFTTGHRSSGKDSDVRGRDPTRTANLLLDGAAVAALVDLARGSRVNLRTHYVGQTRGKAVFVVDRLKVPEEAAD
jgi:hypothetical protein